MQIFRIVTNRKDFESWLKEDSDPHYAFCKFCCKTFSKYGQGINQIELHMKSEKHKLNSSLLLNSKQAAITTKSVYDTGENEKTTWRNQEQKIDSLLQKEQVLKAKIMWAVEVLTNSCSYHSYIDKGTLFS